MGGGQGSADQGPRLHEQDFGRSKVPRTITKLKGVKEERKHTTLTRDGGGGHRGPHLATCTSRSLDEGDKIRGTGGLSCSPDKGQRQARSAVHGGLPTPLAASSQSSDLPPASHWQSLATTGTLTGVAQGRPLLCPPERAVCAAPSGAQGSVAARGRAAAVASRRAARARRGGQVIGRRVMGRRVTAPSDRRRADRRSPQLTSKACGARLSVSEGGRHVARREDDKCAFIRERESCARKPNSFAQPSTYHTSAPRQYEPHLFTKCKPAHPWQHPGSPTRKRRP